MTPPNMTPATPLVCIGITICVITQGVCSGVTGSRPRSGSSLGRPLGVRLAPPDPARSSLLLLRWRGRLLGRLGGLDPALDALLQLNLTLLAPHLPGSTIVSASHRAGLIPQNCARAAREKCSLPRGRSPGRGRRGIR